MWYCVVMEKKAPFLTNIEECICSSLVKDLYKTLGFFLHNKTLP